MSTVDKLIPEILKHSKALVELTEQPNTKSVGWYYDVGQHLKALSQIRDGEYGEGNIDTIYVGKNSWFTQFKESIKTLIKKVFGNK